MQRKVKELNVLRVFLGTGTDMGCYPLQPPSGLYELLGPWTNEFLVGLRCSTFPRGDVKTYLFTSDTELYKFYLVDY